ncbi:MAG: cytochrome ubiquinol oxidase subunit I [Bacteroidales bacterium]|nr:cytochrome ubiquinol oxidase subunit I [Bacteroidales bacterium]
MPLRHLGNYREAKDTDPQAAAQALGVLEENMKYMGYGYLEKPEDVIPPVGIVYWSFRAMVGLGMFLTLVLLLAVWFTYKNRIEYMKWLLWGALLSIPLVYICGQAGWIVAEVGRQPWTIQGLLPVNVAISDVSVAAVKTTFFIFLAIFALFLAIEIRIMIRAIKKGPEIEA